MNHFQKIASFLLVFLLIVCLFSCSTEPAVDLAELKSEFKNPPSSSKPYTWWHWISGFITKEGITKDLEWMNEFGLGGAVVFNVGRLPDDIPRPVPFQTDEWWEMVDHAIREADRLGLKLGFHNCDGWSHSGGPWMEPHESMKKMVWSEVFVKPGDQNIVIPQPETIRDYYEDVAIMALPVKESSSSILVKRLSSNLSPFTSSFLLDGRNETFIDLNGHTPSDPVIFDFQFEKARDISSLSLGTNAGRMIGFHLAFEVSDDGKNYRTIKEFKSQSKGHLGWKTQGKGSSFSFGFPSQNTRYFRLRFLECNSFELNGITLFESARIDQWEAKAAQIQYTEHGGAAEYYQPNREVYKQDFSNSVVLAEKMVDLTDKLGADNRLDWSPPAGNWRVVRIGQTTSGKTNGPSTPEGRGLEADKLNRDALSKHYSNFMQKLVDREVNGETNSLAFTEIDSWEAGVQNWTSGFPEIFKELNGYDMIPFLPVLTAGYIVDSYEVSERFLWDYRKTVANLIRNGAFQHLADLAADDDLMAFAEGSGRQQYLYDPINYMSTAHIPKGEFWAGADGGANIPLGSPQSMMRPRVDCKVASSVAHIYGGQLAASESFTGGRLTWEMGPYDNKMLGDKAFAMGVNWIVLHTSVHQPYSHLKPGFSLGLAGSHFHRNNITYEKNSEWATYLARCQHLLRKGLFVGDVLYFTGEDVPNYLGFREELSVPLPEGYDYDGCNAEILMEQSHVEDGQIVLESGMKYRVLLLPDVNTMSLELLTRIGELVKLGATVIGHKPTLSPGLKGYPDQDGLVATLADEIWGACDGGNIKENSYGKGRVIWGQSFKEIFSGMDLIPDFQYEGGKAGAEINYIHRKLGDVDIYFIANGKDQKEVIHATFRVSDKTPELFLPGSGNVLQTAQYTPGEKSVDVTLNLDKTGSVFVVFSPGKIKPSVIEVNGPESPSIQYAAEGDISGEFYKSGNYKFLYSNGKEQEMEVSLLPEVPVEGIWYVEFPSEREDLARTVTMDLGSWHQSEDPAIKYFSGTALYKKQFELPDGYLAEGIKLYLDLGRVQKLARVSLNGEFCADLWKAPFRVELTDLLKDGMNTLEVEVTNTWTNKLIGDEQLPPDLKYQRFLSEIPEWLDGKSERPSKRETFAILRFYQSNDKLIESGLIGPVVIEPSVLRELN